MTVNQGVLMECFGAFPEGILAGGGVGIWKDSIRNGSKWYSSIEEGGW